MPDDIAKTVSLLVGPGDTVEVRGLSDDGVASGYFDDPVKLVQAIEALDGAGMQGVYLTLNPVNPALLARRANRVKMRLGKKDATTADSDIVTRKWFPVDIDAKRPSGVSTTDLEHDLALRKSEVIAACLAERQWPEPVMADSGNGAHLLYPIGLSNGEISADLVKQGLNVLDILYSDGAVSVDTGNYNAARIWKCYGTFSRKGDSTNTRPHRRSRLLAAPDKLGVVTQEMLRELIDSLPTEKSLGLKPEPLKKGRSFDLSVWLLEHGIGVAIEKPYHQGGTLFVLDECPFGGSHKDGAYAIQFPSGAIFAGCHHTSCGGGIQRWPDLRERYEPAKVSTDTPVPGNNTQRNKVQASPPRPPPIPCVTDLPGYREAVSVLKSGDPLKFMLETFALDHVGDEIVAECLIMSFASRSVENTKGLHVSVTGESGKGKSDAFYKFLAQVPDRFRLEGAMSNKALFYIDDLNPGTAIVFDDKILSEEVQEILKGATTSFKEPIRYRTVNKDRKAQVCTIPARCVWWMAKVEGSGDDQVLNRMLTCWIDDTPEQDARVLAAVLKQESELPDRSDGIRPEVQVCRAMWELIGNECLHVHIPFASRFRFQTLANRRNPEMFVDLVKAHATLFSHQRERHRFGEGGSYIIATLDDFAAAARLYGLLNGGKGGQETKLTRREAEFLNTIIEMNETEFTIPQMQRDTHYSYNVVYRILHGYMSRGVEYTGLLEKCPAISFTDRTVVITEETGRSVKRRTHAYQFDQELFRLWSRGGAVWLSEEEDHNDDEDHDNQDDNHNNQEEHHDVGSCTSTRTSTVCTDSAADEMAQTGAEIADPLSIKNIILDEVVAPTNFFIPRNSAKKLSE